MTTNQKSVAGQSANHDAVHLSAILHGIFRLLLTEAALSAASKCMNLKQLCAKAEKYETEVYSNK